MEERRENKLAKGCLGCFTLAQGVNIIAGIDLFQGILTVALGLLVFMMPEVRDPPRCLARSLSPPSSLPARRAFKRWPPPLTHTGRPPRQNFRGHALAHHYLYNETTSDPPLPHGPFSPSQRPTCNGG